jgi:hypothetical protein
MLDFPNKVKLNDLKALVKKGFFLVQLLLRSIA